MNALPVMMRLFLVLLLAVAPLGLPVDAAPAGSSHHDRSALQTRQDGTCLLFLTSRTDGHLTLSMPRKAPIGPAWAAKLITRPVIHVWTEGSSYWSIPDNGCPHPSLLQLKSLLTI
ncbi:MAG: hypothetical protein LLG01_12185 [Planctomycetaceae bacterium]|nr:hypothetical protein [Planctomycetaceae bacterium]